MKVPGSEHNSTTVDLQICILKARSLNLHSVTSYSRFFIVLHDLHGRIDF